MKKSKFLLMAVALLALSAIQLNAAKELKLVARYNYSPDGQLQSVLTPVSDNGAVKTSYSRSYLSDGKIKVCVHKKNLEFNELAFVPSVDAQASNGTGQALLAPAGDRGSLAFSTGEGLHDYREEFASYQVASKGDITPDGLDKGILVREYIEKAGRKLEETDMLGNTSKYYYNKLGQLIKVSSFGEGNEVSKGAELALPVPSGGTAGRSESEMSSTSFTYDKLGRLAKTEDEIGRVTGRVYDPEGRVAERINPLDDKSFVNYDKYGRVVSKSGAGAYPLSFEYNSFGEINAYADANGSKTQFEYDTAGRLVKRIWTDGSVVSYSYNDKGLLSKKLEGKKTTIYDYDEFNRLAKIEIYQNPQKSVTTLKHDTSGKLVEISDENGKIIFSYDSFGRMTSEKGSVGEIYYEYNSQGLLSAKLCVLNSKEFKTAYSYDNFDRITQVSSPAGTYSYTYNNKGRIASLSFGDVIIRNEYDKAERLVSKSFTAGDSKTQLATYEYDKLDRRVKAEVNGVKWSYGYDEYNQLTSASSSDGYIYGYDFDKIGNRKSAVLSEKGSEIIKTDFEYNALNQIANQGFQYDAYGNLIKSQDTEYVYDLNNRLTEVRKPNVTVKYSYDPLGQRIKSEEFTAGDVKTAKVTQFLMSGMVEQARITNSVAQYHTLGLDLAQSLTATGGVGAVLASTSYVIPSNSDTLTPAGKASDETLTLSYLYDGNGNVIASTDSRTIIAKLAYSPFGEKLSGADLSFAFSTKALDASGLSYYGFRFFSAQIGRWMSKDPIEERGVQLLSNNYLNIVSNKILTYEEDRILLEKLINSMNISAINIPIDKILLFISEKPFSPAAIKFDMFKANSFTRVSSVPKHEPLYIFCANSPLLKQDYLGLVLCDDIWYNAPGDGGTQMCSSHPDCVGEAVDAPCEGDINCPKRRCRNLGYTDIFGDRACCGCSK